MPARNPRTLCGCQSVAATSSTRVAPSRRVSSSKHRDADDLERLQAAVEDNVDTISGAHRSSFGIGLVDYDFIGAGWID